MKMKMKSTSRLTLQRIAFAISVISIVYCTAEGAVSIALGFESESRSLIFFGIQSAIEVASACVVTWRFRRALVEKEVPGEEDAVRKAKDLRVEKIGTWSVGILIAILALATLGSAIGSLVTHDEPTTSPASLIVSASALVLMILLWLPKRYLARALDSSTMAGEAACSLSCIQITLVVFVGALVFKISRKAWWVDSAACILLSLLFAREAWKMLAWVMNPEFNGGCCGGCAHPKTEDKRQHAHSHKEHDLEKGMAEGSSATVGANGDARGAEKAEKGDCKCHSSSSTFTLNAMPDQNPKDEEDTSCCRPDKKSRKGFSQLFISRMPRIFWSQDTSAHVHSHAQPVALPPPKQACCAHKCHSGETPHSSAGTSKDKLGEDIGVAVQETPQLTEEIDFEETCGAGLAPVSPPGLTSLPVEQTRKEEETEVIHEEPIAQAPKCSGRCGK